MSEETTNPKTLLPYDNSYVLLSKRALLVNTLVVSTLCNMLSKHTKVSPDAIANSVGNAANLVISQMTDEEVSDAVAKIVAGTWKNAEKGLIVTTTEFSHDKP